MVELEGITSPYEFEDRAGFFMSDVIEISKDFPDLRVEAENKTLDDLEANAWAIEKSAKLNKLEMNRKAFLRGYEMDINSADEAAVMITVCGVYKKDIREFERSTDQSAKNFGGIRINAYGVKDFEGDGDDFRFFICLSYRFH